MKITIIGWYGTETIGDRAILAGLFSFFHRSVGDFEIKLGSLHPFFSERTISEDYSFYKEIIGKDFIVDIFNSRNSKELLNAIANSDLVVMGGGPLMDLNELFMVEYAFKKAHKLGIKTAIMGCGIGPLFHKKYRKSVLEVTKNSDLTVLRDNKSKSNLKDIYREFNVDFDEAKTHTSFDPSVECALFFNKLCAGASAKYIAINLRAFPSEYGRDIDPAQINDALKQTVGALSNVYQENEIKLIPMHYFHIGGDDREFLNRIALDLNRDNITVQNSNLSLIDTMEVYANAYFNIGMRFHSVVLQTISSGKNFVFDYTEPKKGKISGFLHDIDGDHFYADRYISLHENEITADMVVNVNRQFCYDETDVKSRLSIYVERLNEFKNQVLTCGR
ncbi:hypothetical protein MNBD_GAMMA26-804 [hydrothermal vent metagenome]|uniref:Polysaccharide pyruvyl transferase domain-containing protein n=1 Tax=hydrothermal vent metagenome TaxID=652676 RepID=A0A3B1AXW0_9ZZZZ